jgi:uncharacterized cysteine cluster protein YcgN (CxxCxxCC family)
MSAPAPFWKKPLADLTRGEWERLCDGCGRCCLVKLEDEDTAQVHYTDVACRLLDQASCRCGNYANRARIVLDCVRLTRGNVKTLPWLPPTCAYRLRANGEDLPAWHPLVSGDPDTVVKAGISVRGRISASEDDVEIDDLPDHIARWPGRWPKRAR